MAAASNWFGGAYLFHADVPTLSNDFATALVNGNFAFATGNPNTSIVSTSLVNTGLWVHVAATRVKATGAISIFVNGVLEASGTSTNTGPLDGSNTASLGPPSNGAAFYFTGDLDEVRA